MGCSIHIQRANGQEGDLVAADLASALTLFNAIPWREEIAQWETVPREDREERRPLFQIFDDAAHSLHITAYSENLIALAYNYLRPASPFGLSYEEDDGYIGADQFPRAEVPALFQCFFQCNTPAMLSLLGRYPTVTEPPHLAP